jgi:hypothetical protein
MSYWMEMQAREKLGDQLREAQAWRLSRMAQKPAHSPTRPDNRRRLRLRRDR